MPYISAGYGSCFPAADCGRAESTWNPNLRVPGNGAAAGPGCCGNRSYRTGWNNRRCLCQQRLRGTILPDVSRKLLVLLAAGRERQTMRRSCSQPEGRWMVITRCVAIAGFILSLCHTTSLEAHGGGCRKDSLPGQCCHMNRKTGQAHCHCRWGHRDPRLCEEHMYLTPPAKPD